MPQCVNRCRRARRSELWPPRYWLVHLFHSHIAQLVAAACRAPLAAPQVAPQYASPISKKSLNTLHMLNFKPNLTQGKVVLINVESALETNEDSPFLNIQDIKSEMPDEGTFVDVNETNFDVKVDFIQDNVLSNENVVKNNEVFIEVDEIVPETVLFVTDKELNEGIAVKEEPKEPEVDNDPNSDFNDPFNISNEISDLNMNKAGVSSSEVYTNSVKMLNFENDNGDDRKSDTSDEVSNLGSGDSSDDTNIFSDNSVDLDDNGISSDNEDDKELTKQISKCRQISSRSYSSTQLDTQEELNVIPESDLEIKKEVQNSTENEVKIKKYVRKRAKLKRSRGIDCFCKKYNMSYMVMSEEERVDDMTQKRLSKRYTDAKFKCDGCFKVFPSESNLKKHLDELHDLSKNFSCKYCAKSFSSSKLQKVHVTRNHRYKITCNVCGLVSKQNV
ncbi:hypothetical protein K1T71_015005 [Dendrolimus kikuchii]|nr:hypothetical protein K1T71_015005 [Dendrolimus kikuchii]